jgi:hypothetical protein
MTAFLRKRRWWLAVLTFILTVMAVSAGIAIWTDPPIEYYGRWMWQHELHQQVTHSIFCVANSVTDWYRQLARIVPAPSTFICVNTDSEARLWMSQNLH